MIQSSSKYPLQKRQHFHLHVTQILIGLIHSGFEIKAVIEAEPPEDMMDMPGFKDEMRRPMMLLVKAEKQ